MKHLYTQQAQIGACWVTYYWLCYGIKKTDWLSSPASFSDCCLVGVDQIFIYYLLAYFLFASHLLELPHYAGVATWD